MKNIVLIPSNTDLNRGDEALVWESASLIKDVFSEEGVYLSVVGNRGTSEIDILQTRQTKALGYNILEPILRHPGRKQKDKSKEIGYTWKTIISWGIIAISDLIYSLLLLSKFKVFWKIGFSYLDNNQKETYNKLKESDGVFVKGGGFIHSYGGIADTYKIYFFLYSIILSQKLNKKVFILPNSIGPLKNPIAHFLTKKVLSRCTLVTTRESISQNFLESNNIKSFRFPDLGFYLEPSSQDYRNYLIEKGVDFSKNNVLITLRPYRFEGKSNPDLLYDNYINSVIKLIEYLSEEKYGITFFAHTLGPGAHEDDRIALEYVIEQLPNHTKSPIAYISDYNLTCRDVEKIYSYYDFLVGTRFHSVIFSLNVNVPAIAISYGGNKGKGIMEDIHNNDYVLEMDKLTENSLVNSFNKLLNNREKYLSNLQFAKKEIIAKRLELISLIRDKYYEN